MSPARAGDEAELDAALSAAAEEEGGLLVDVAGFEGPLHVLLALARTRKIDLRAIPIVDLVDQYLAFVAAARALRLELAADYLVMAAWLAYLKSRLLLPQPQRGAEEEGEPPPEELARRLAFRLQRLEAMREAAQELMGRDLLGRDVHARGAPESPHRGGGAGTATLYDLLSAYGARRSKTARARVVIPKPLVYALDEARRRLEAALGGLADWRRLDELLPPPHAFVGPVPPRRSILASAFVAGLELAKAGRVELRQEAPFGVIRLRARRPQAVS